jgi:hypothetical protein
MVKAKKWHLDLHLLVSTTDKPARSRWDCFFGACTNGAKWSVCWSPGPRPLIPMAHPLSIGPQPILFYYHHDDVHHPLSVAISPPTANKQTPASSASSLTLVGSSGDVDVHTSAISIAVWSLIVSHYFNPRHKRNIMDQPLHRSKHYANPPFVLTPFSNN